MKQLIIPMGLPLLAYMIGSIPSGLLLVLAATGQDVRISGSGNIGATNVRRTAGTVWGIATLVFDVLKGALPTFLALYLMPHDYPWLASATGIGAILGHMFPVYLKFKPSGKGVATALGCYGVLAPPACGLALICFVMVMLFKRIVSLASLVAMALLPLFIWITTCNIYITLTSILSAVLIIIRHQTNLRRLIQGKESVMGK